jgi:hypothetical protein
MNTEDDIMALSQMRKQPPSVEPFGHPEVALPKRAPELLESGAATYRERNKVYGDNYHHFGQLMMGLFPRGITVNTPEDWNRLALVINCAGKLQRYTQSFARGGHQDSAHDLMVYAAMLEELTK